MEYIKDLMVIKDKFGEDMMRFCRKSFSLILEKEGRLPELLQKHFACSKNLYNDIIDCGFEEQFKDYIYSLLENEYEKFETNKTPSEILKEKGYTLYECKTEEDIQKFKKYYHKREELCTFLGGKLKKRYVFFAVKDNYEQIKREDFPNPSRNDAYSTSVLSIQFDKGYYNYTSIISRYNYSVNNPDATFSANLDYISPGLQSSFEKEYNLNLSYPKNVKLYLPNYVTAEDGKMYKYNYEINDIYYCPNNTIIDHGKVITDYMEPERYIVFNYFILNLKEKKVALYDKTLKDSFIDGIINIKKIHIKKVKASNEKTLIIKPIIGEDIICVLDKFNNLISYKNNNIYETDKNFLQYDTTVNRITLDNVRTIGDNFMPINNKVEDIYFPNLLIVKDNFFYSNNHAKIFYLPRVVIIGNNCMYWNINSLEALFAEKVESIGDNLLYYNTSLKEINIEKASDLGENILKNNKCLETIVTPNLQNVSISYYDDGTSKVLSLK